MQTGTIPTQIGMLTVISDKLGFFNASLTGSVPTRKWEEGRADVLTPHPTLPNVKPTLPFTVTF